MSEEWKQITEYVPKRGMTEVSSLGRVRKTFKDRRGSAHEPRRSVKTITYIPKLSKGAKYRNLYVAEFSRKWRLHQIIYLAFKGEVPDEYVIDHIDGNKLNNSIDNLEAVSRRENGRRWAEKKKGKGFKGLGGKCRKGHDKQGRYHCLICRKNNWNKKTPLPAGNWKKWHGYMVSDKGEVWSTYQSKLRKPTLSNSGYAFLMFNPAFRKKSGKINWSVHRIVWDAWRGKTDKVIDHIDGDRLNNNLSNLEAVTQSENMRRAWERRKRREVTNETN